MVQDVSIGIVADWLVTYAGAERVIKEFVDLYPESSLYAIVDFLSEDARKELHCKKVQTS
ncbi:glycosyltransferase family 4 protein, partial [Klebsiella pneumoniae]